MTRLKCTYCAGTGHVATVPEVHDDTCPKCEGRGYIEALR